MVLKAISVILVPQAQQLIIQLDNPDTQWVNKVGRLALTEELSEPATIRRIRQPTPRHHIPVSIVGNLLLGI